LWQLIEARAIIAWLGKILNLDTPDCMFYLVRVTLRRNISRRREQITNRLHAGYTVTTGLLHITERKMEMLFIVTSTAFCGNNLDMANAPRRHLFQEMENGARRPEEEHVESGEQD
jgi:hypothetical protein